MAHLAQTGDGLTATLGDTWSASVRQFGDAFQGAAKDSIEFLIKLLQKLQADGTIQRWAEAAVKALTPVKNLIQAVLGGDGETRGEALKAAWDYLKQVFDYGAGVMKAAGMEMARSILGVAPALVNFVGKYTGSQWLAAKLSGTTVEAVQEDTRRMFQEMLGEGSFAEDMEAAGKGMKEASKAFAQTISALSERAKARVSAAAETATAPLPEDGGLAKATEDLKASDARRKEAAETEADETEEEAARKRKEAAQAAIRLAEEEKRKAEAKLAEARKRATDSDYERMSREGEKSFAQLLEEGGSGSFVRYRGLTWVYNKAEMETAHERIVVTRFSIKDDAGKTIGASTDLVYPRGQGGTIPDSSILTRMDNQINNAEKAIGKLKGDIASYNELRRKIQKQIDEMPDMSELNKQWLDKRREKNWLEKAIEAGCETGKEARNYFDKSFPGKVPDYEWTTPEFDKKMGRSEEAESPVGSLREAASVPFGELERWGRALDNYAAGRLSLNRPVTVLNRTPEIIRRVIEEVGGKQFANDRPITMRVENLDKITGMDIYTRSGKHNIPVSELRKLQLELDNPVAIFVSDTRPDTSLVILTELVDKAEGDAKAIVALQYAYHPDGNWMSLKPLRANLLSSAYGGKSAGTIKKWAVRAKGKDFLLKYVNTGKAGSWEEATRLQLPFAHGALASIAGQSAVLTEKDFSMDEKGKVLKDGKLVNPKDVGMTRENGAWEKDLAKRLAKRGLTEDDLSPDAQAYLRARRARTEAQPMTRRAKVAAFVEEAIHPHEGETRRAFAKRKAVAAADFVTRKMVDVRAPLIQAQREIAGETLQCRMSSGRARCGAASALPPSRMSDSCVRRRFRGDVAHQWCSGERVSPQTLPTLGPNPLGFGVRPLRVSPQTLPTRAPSPPFRYEKQIAVRKWCPGRVVRMRGGLRVGICAATFAGHHWWHTVAYRRFLFFLL